MKFEVARRVNEDNVIAGWNEDVFFRTSTLTPTQQRVLILLALALRRRRKFQASSEG